MPNFGDRTGSQPDDGDMIALSRAAAQKELDAIKPDRITEPRCLVCTHEQRDWIEAMLIRGASYTQIGERVSPQVDRRSVSNHHKKHMDLQDAILIGILEEEAEKQGRLNDEHASDILTRRGILEVAIRKGYEDLQSGVTTVEPKDLIQMMKLAEDMDSNYTEVSIGEMKYQVEVFMEAIKSVVSEEQQNQIVRKVKQLRERDDVKRELENALTSGDVEGQVIEE